MDCIDLREAYGDVYVVTCETGERSIRDPWTAVIQGRRGHIYVHGEQSLAVAVDHHPKAIRQLQKVPSCRLLTLGSDGANLLFDRADFEEVAAIIQLRKRRRASAETRQHLRAIGAATQFRRHTALRSV